MCNKCHVPYLIPSVKVDHLLELIGVVLRVYDTRAQDPVR